MADNTCSICKKNFTRKQNLYRHLQLKHKITGSELSEQKKIILASNPNKTETCNVCHSKFTTAVSLRRHRSTIHNISEKVQSRIICPEDGCKESFTRYKMLREHLTNTHNYNISKEELSFGSESEFQQWKENYERFSGTSYILQSSPIPMANSVKTYYYCHCSYQYRRQGKGIRTLKSTGSIKIGVACPSTIIVNKTLNTINVDFWKTHANACKVGVQHTLLSKTERTQIAVKLQQGVSFQHIIDEIRGSGTKEDSLRRIHLLERKDLHNIVRDFNISYSTKRHSDDAISVRLWVEEMQALGDDSPVIKYKEQGKEEDIDSLSKNDFLLILMTPFQKEQLQKFGGDKICIDGTHGTNAYDFYLYTLIVIDEYANGCPVAFCFSNRQDQFIFQVFFKYIKQEVGLVKSQIFMSDDAPAFYNAWELVMCSVTHRLLCTWHVDKNWRNNLAKIAKDEKKVLVYKTLRVLLEILQIDEFNNALSNFVTDLLADADTVAYGEYFVRTYANRTEVWAYCHRQHLGINTNMYLESMHRTLKYFYLEGKNVKRLDKTLCAVMKIARDTLFNRVIKLMKNRCPQRVSRIRQSHQMGKNISATNIKVLDNDKEWAVTSMRNPLKEYHVRRLLACSDTDCLLKCVECNICIHSFTCTCLDNVIRYNICKHIHACLLLNYQEPNCTIPEPSCSISVLNADKEIEHIVRASGVSKSSGSELLLLKAQQLVTMISNSNLNTEQVRLCNKYYDQLIKTINDPDVKFTTTNHVNERSNIDRQVRLFSTKKAKKKKNNLPKPSVSETISISQALENVSSETLNIHSGFDHNYSQ